MKPKIKPIEYWDSQQFDKDIESIFLTQWIMVGFTDQLQKHQDFIVRNLGPVSVVIQRFNDSLKAFTNVCTHRFSRIQCEESGNRPLMCPYHGWNFDENGRPIGIPQKPHFGSIDETEMKALCLRPWTVDVSGRFVFVRYASEGPSLAEFLGEASETLSQFSKGMGDLIDRNELNLECNWKIAIENTLESYHVATIHPKTFYRLGASGLAFQFQGPHSRWDTGVNEKTQKQWMSIAKYFESRPIKLEGYCHQLIFPNTTLASTYGNTFSIQSFLPVAADKTHFISWVFSTPLNTDKPIAATIQKESDKAIIQFNRQVFNEDKDICKEVQKGACLATNDGLLSDLEYRVHAFQEQCYLLKEGKK